MDTGRRISNIFAVAILVPLMLFSCTMELSGPASLSDRVLVTRSARLMEVYLDEVVSALGEESAQYEEVLASGYTAREIATRALEEENGRAYLEFCLYADDYGSTDEVFNAAQSLVGQGDLERVKADVDKVESLVFEEADEISRGMTTSQKKAFYGELRKLVVKAAVLLTAAIVYACVPTMMFWGKITAASAVAVAGGVLATTIMCIIEYYHTDGEVGSFDEWLESVAVEPSAAWAIASAVISTNSALGYSPILVAVILGVFAIYGIIDDVKPLLKY